MWYITTFQPVSLVSLKLATATSTGGKSLLLPTPFALKMALLGVVIQMEGLRRGEALWPSVRDGRVAIYGPSHIAVTNTFTKILKPMKGKPTLDEESGLTRGMIKTIGFREYVQWQGEVQIAFSPGVGSNHEWPAWFTAIHYIGKRGGFIQATDTCQQVDTLPDGFIRLDEPATEFMLHGTLQLMDDCGSKVTFEQVDIYSGKNMRTGAERILRQVVVPYRVERSSRSYTLYSRLD
jgi:hypothetical protein